MEQQTLGTLIELLKTVPQQMAIQELKPHSYRGYYDELAFEINHDHVVTVESTITLLENCVGKIFEGYKGGEFTMDYDTPVWIAYEGCIGEEITGLQLFSNGIRFITKE